MDRLKSLNAKQAKFLQAKGYTLETLATAGVKEIAALAGFGPKSARAIIEEARQAVNAAKLSEGSSEQAPASAMSARVRRLKELNG